MKTGYYRLEHTYFSRGGNKYHGPSGAFHLSSVQNYDANSNRAEHIKSVNLPDDRYALYAKLLAHSNTITRKNGRMAERFILSHDVNMSKAHRVEATLAFVDKVTLGGKLKAYAYHHDQDTHNPHGHVCVIDVGPDGKPHGHFGRNGTYRREHSPVKGNVTEWFRKEWEMAQNEVLERHGYDFRVDRRSNLERGLDPAERHLGPQRAVMQLAAQEVDLPHEAKEPAVTPDELIHHIMERQESGLDDLASVTPAEYVEGALELNKNIKWLDTTRERIERLTNEAEVAQTRAKEYLAEHHKRDRESDIHRNAVDLISDDLAPLTREDGSYKGFAIKIFGREIASPKYKQARELDLEKRYQDWKRQEARELADRHLSESQRQADMAEALIEKAQAAERELNEVVESYGENIGETVELMKAGIQQNLSHLTPEQVVAEHELGALTAEQAYEALELMGAQDYQVRIELRDRQEREQEGLEVEP